MLPRLLASTDICQFIFFGTRGKRAPRGRFCSRPAGSAFFLAAPSRGKSADSMKKHVYTRAPVCVCVLDIILAGSTTTTTTTRKMKNVLRLTRLPLTGSIKGCSLPFSACLLLLVANSCLFRPLPCPDCAEYIDWAVSVLVAWTIEQQRLDSSYSSPVGLAAMKRRSRRFVASLARRPRENAE